MRLTRKHALALSALAVLAVSSIIGAQTQPGQDVKSDYDRANSLTTRVQGKVYNEALSTGTLYCENFR